MNKLYSLIVALAIATIAFLPTKAAAQGIGFTTDFKTTEPSYAFKVAEFDTFLKWKVRTEILAYAGSKIEQGTIVGGGAWVYPFQLAKGPAGMTTLWGYVGIGANFENGRFQNLRLAFGVRY